MLKIGNKVKVMIPPKEQASAGAARQYQGTVTVVEAINNHYHGKCAFGHTYELEGCRSAFGIPFIFPEEWLIPMDDEVAL